MSNDANETDDTLRERLSERLDFMSSTDTDDDESTTEQEADSDTTDGGDGATEQEGDYEDDEDDEEDGETEMEMDAGEAVDMLVANTDMDREEAMAFAEALGGGADHDDDGGDTGDDDGEMSAEADVDAAEVADAAAEAASEVVEQELDERLDGVVTEDDLDAKLESFTDTMIDETKTTVEQMATGSTPGPDSAGSTDISKDDLFSNDAESGDNGGD